NKLVKNLNLNSNVIIWHLKILEKFNYIQKTLIDNRMIYFKHNMNLSKVQKIYFLKKKEIKRILNFFKENNSGVTKTRLAESLNMHYNTLKKYVNKLEKLSLIKKLEKQNSIVYCLNLKKYNDIISNVN
ncbi:MAG: winged helix-turn-helix transcriptional regulator, partial [Candidatus Lokiarchaeota archaeon]|nr:winged helix-turn-helix transcriptional regulator [Candidatus Lokiarchaeota archaeon]